MTLRAARHEMRGIHRARLLLVLAAALSLAIVVAELPLSTIVHQRSAIAGASERLGAIEAENARLANQVASLARPSTVASIAHAEYGLVKPGQLAYAVLPAKGQSVPSALTAGPVPSEDLVPPTASPFGSPPAAGAATRRGPQPGLWSQVLDRLAFWHSAF